MMGLDDLLLILGPTSMLLAHESFVGRERVRARANAYALKARREGDFEWADYMAEQAERGTGVSVWPLPDPGPCAEHTT